MAKFEVHYDYVLQIKYIMYLNFKYIKFEVHYGNLKYIMAKFETYIYVSPTF